VRPVPRGLVLTFAAVSLLTLALAALLMAPASGLRPVRQWPLDLDEPTPSSP
jgi:hypothetical protein